jgi:hypothetical protein
MKRVLLTGMSGTGKATVIAELAARLKGENPSRGLPWQRTEQREQCGGVSIVTLCAWCGDEFLSLWLSRRPMPRRRLRRQWGGAP